MSLLMSAHFILNLHGKNLLLFLQGLYLTLLLAIVLFFGLNATVGNLTYTNDPVIGNIIPGSSAEQAHLESNDRILTIDGKKICTWDDIRPSLQGTANHGVTVVVDTRRRNCRNYGDS